jgi:hypothetical protein
LTSIERQFEKFGVTHDGDEKLCHHQEVERQVQALEEILESIMIILLSDLDQGLETLKSTIVGAQIGNPETVSKMQAI